MDMDGPLDPLSSDRKTRDINESMYICDNGFAKQAEALYKPDDPTNWTIGEDTCFNRPPSPVAWIRSAQFPKIDQWFKQNVAEQDWATNDYYGKAGIQNRWFYICWLMVKLAMGENPSEPIWSTGYWFG